MVPLADGTASLGRRSAQRMYVQAELDGGPDFLRYKPFNPLNRIPFAPDDESTIFDGATYAKWKESEEGKRIHQEMWEAKLEGDAHRAHDQQQQQPPWDLMEDEESFYSWEGMNRDEESSDEEEEEVEVDADEESRVDHNDVQSEFELAAEHVQGAFGSHVPLLCINVRIGTDNLRVRVDANKEFSIRINQVEAAGYSPSPPACFSLFARLRLAVRGSAESTDVQSRLVSDDLQFDDHVELDLGTLDAARDLVRYWSDEQALRQLMSDAKVLPNFPDDDTQLFQGCHKLLATMKEASLDGMDRADVRLLGRTPLVVLLQYEPYNRIRENIVRIAMSLLNHSLHAPGKQVVEVIAERLKETPNDAHLVRIAQAVTARGADIQFLGDWIRRFAENTDTDNMLQQQRIVHAFCQAFLPGGPREPPEGVVGVIGRDEDQEEWQEWLENGPGEDGWERIADAFGPEAYDAFGPGGSFGPS